MEVKHRILIKLIIAALAIFCMLLFGCTNEEITGNSIVEPVVIEEEPVIEKEPEIVEPVKEQLTKEAYERQVHYMIQSVDTTIERASDTLDKLDAEYAGKGFDDRDKHNLRRELENLHNFAEKQAQNLETIQAPEEYEEFHADMVHIAYELAELNNFDIGVDSDINGTEIRDTLGMYDNEGYLDQVSDELLEKTNTMTWWEIKPAEMSWEEYESRYNQLFTDYIGLMVDYYDLFNETMEEDVV